MDLKTFLDQVKEKARTALEKRDAKRLHEEERIKKSNEAQYRKWLNTIGLDEDGTVGEFTVWRENGYIAVIRTCANCGKLVGKVGLFHDTTELGSLMLKEHTCPPPVVPVQPETDELQERRIAAAYLTRSFEGILLREWFAGMALPGLVAASRGVGAASTHFDLAGAAYELADAMLKKSRTHG